MTTQTRSHCPPGSGCVRGAALTGCTRPRVLPAWLSRRPTGRRHVGARSCVHDSARVPLLPLAQCLLCGGRHRPGSEHAAAGMALPRLPCRVLSAARAHGGGRAPEAARHVAAREAAKPTRNRAATRSHPGIPRVCGGPGAPVQLSLFCGSQHVL